MRLFVICHNPDCNAKIYIMSNAKERSELESQFELRCPNCEKRDIFERTDVLAEISSISGSGVAIMSGFVGLLVGGPIGGILGAVGGGTIGVGIEQKDRKTAKEFNESE